MKPAEISVRRRALGWATPDEAAAVFHVSRRTWFYWESGERTMPWTAQMWLKAMSDDGDGLRGAAAWLERQE